MSRRGGKQKPASLDDENDENPTLETELVLASDGALHVSFEGNPPRGRRVFVGYALTAEECAELGTRGLLTWAMLQTLALGSDGAVYVEAGAIGAEGREVFRGYAATPEEAEQIVDDLHRAAWNLTITARRLIRAR
ncbi:hypothetical protein [Polyangium spumosum]|uniref:Uncharacterized protein n=1 Tax=Polyangium spumosum TaxID=889282 RepID=A0A6N7Q684_9BACT|nr:hypothetical protein [Polyangium spumosum]MRG98195.1 hypothetical protein [Polyangium spumosum]